MKEFNLICAVSLNGVIGNSADNSIPWFLPSDLKNFKQITTGKTVVMGSRTYASLGRNLPNRRNVVISRGLNGIEYQPDAIHSSFAEALRVEQSGFFVIGGEHIYGESLRYRPSRLYLTQVLMEAAGDVRFPIAGDRLHYDNIVTPAGDSYMEESRSDVMNEQGIDFRYIVYKRA
jgi:dihydrofolate reductase